jgi:hypothetical protein
LFTVMCSFGTSKSKVSVLIRNKKNVKMLRNYKDEGMECRANFQYAQRTVRKQLESNGLQTARFLVMVFL